MTRSDDDMQKLQNFWLQVFGKCRANGANYQGENLPAQSWTWPTDTYLQRRRHQLRVNPAVEPIIVAQNDPASQRVDPTVAEQPTLEHVPQISELALVDGTESEFFPQAEQAPLAEAQPLLIEFDDTDERFFWLAAPTF